MQVGSHQQGPSRDPVASTSGRWNSYKRGRASIDRPNLDNRRSADKRLDTHSRGIIGADGRYDSLFSPDSYKSFERRFNSHNREFRGEQVMGRARNGWRRPMSM